MSVQNKIEFVIFISLVKIFNLFGIKRAKTAAKILAFLFYNLIPLRKDIVIKNLRIAFPDYSENRIQQLAHDIYYNIAISIIEIFCLPYLDANKVKAMVYCQDVDAIKKKLDLNKGLIFLTAHFGNWELGASWMGLLLDRPISVMAKNQRNELVTNWLNWMRERFGNTVIPLGVSVRNLFKELMNKNIIGVVGDQRGPVDGVRVKFFGRDTATYPGTAQLALRTSAPIVVVMMVRQKDFTYRACVEVIETEDLAGDEQSKVIEINQRYMSILEGYIRKFPEQWFWMHNIWKY